MQSDLKHEKITYEKGLFLIIMPSSMEKLLWATSWFRYKKI